MPDRLRRAVGGGSLGDERLDLTAVVPDQAASVFFCDQQTAPELNKIIKGVASFFKGVADACGEMHVVSGGSRHVSWVVTETIMQGPGLA